MHNICDTTDDMGLYTQTKTHIQTILHTAARVFGVYAGMHKHIAKAHDQYQRRLRLHPRLLGTRVALLNTQVLQAHTANKWLLIHCRRKMPVTLVYNAADILQHEENFADSTCCRELVHNVYVSAFGRSSTAISPPTQSSRSLQHFTGWHRCTWPCKFMRSRVRSCIKEKPFRQIRVWLICLICLWPAAECTVQNNRLFDLESWM